MKNVDLVSLQDSLEKALFDDEIGGSNSSLEEAKLTQSQSKSTLLLYKWECLECAHLIPQKGAKYSKCTLQNGNKSCPAGYVKLELSVPIEGLASKLATARLSGDMKAYTRRVARLGRLSAAQAEAVFTRVEELVQAGRLL